MENKKGRSSPSLIERYEQSKSRATPPLLDRSRSKNSSPQLQVKVPWKQRLKSAYNNPHKTNIITGHRVNVDLRTSMQRSQPGPIFVAELNNASDRDIEVQRSFPNSPATPLFNEKDIAGMEERHGIKLAEIKSDTVAKTFSQVDGDESKDMVSQEPASPGLDISRIMDGKKWDSRHEPELDLEEMS